MREKRESLEKEVRDGNKQLIRHGVQNNSYRDAKELSANYSSKKREIEAVNNNQTEMKNDISDIKNTLEGIKSRLDEAEG